MELTSAEIQSWLVNPVTEKWLKPELERVKTRLIDALTKIGKKQFTDVREVELYQLELQLVNIYLLEPQKLLEHIRSQEERRIAENAGEEND